MPEPLREKRVELILQQLEELPTLPAVALRVLQATGDDNASAHDVVELISSDPALTTRLLQLLHTAGVGVDSQLESIPMAVVLLGFDAIRNMTLALSVFQAFGDQQQNKKSHFQRAEFWKHSIAVACCAELMAMKLKPDTGNQPAITSSEAFVCGLLHDIGKIAFDAALPKSFDRVVEAADLLRTNIADLERNIIGLDHTVVGKRLAEKWGLPTCLCECIWLHGQNPTSLPATTKNPRMINLITLADHLVREQHLGYSGNYTFPISRKALMDAIGIQHDDVDQCLRELVSHVEPRAEALGLNSITSNELYLQSLSQANKELSRTTQQLSAKNKKLSVRAKYFDAMSKFQSACRAQSTPRQILEAIGQVAVDVLDLTSAAMVSIPHDDGIAETLLVDADGEVFQHSTVECPKIFPAMGGGLGPVLSAGNELDWLMSHISPRLAYDQRYWVALELEGRCIGGIVWGAKPGEANRLANQVQEITGLLVGWSLALGNAQIREEYKKISEQLADANRLYLAAEEKNQRSKTLISLGEMAAGAAHEMNNPLAVISGRSQLLTLQLTDPKQKHAAELIFEQSHRVSEIITELMDFAKPAPPVRAETDLVELVERALHEAKLLSDPADRSIEVTIADVPTVMVDPKQLTAALTEVISNAIQATDENRGHVTIHAAFETSSNKVVISINDNGCGMDDETLKRAFDPFFSSLPAGRRRGLGLAKALRWIQASGGTIQLESRVGIGTRTVILLAAVSANEVPRVLQEQVG